jgi:hypothetical protein
MPLPLRTNTRIDIANPEISNYILPTGDHIRIMQSG